MKLLKKLTKKEYVAIGITVIMLSTLFLFQTAWLRFLETAWHLIQSFAYYFVELFCIFTGTDNMISPGVVELSRYVNMDTAFPLLWSDFELKMQAFWTQLTDASNFGNYLGIMARFLYYFSLVVMLLAPPLIVLFFVCKRYMLRETDNKTNEDSKALKKWRRFEKKCQPHFAKIKSFFDFLDERDIYKKLWLCIWLLNLNVFSIAFESIAYLLYLVVSFDASNLYLQVYKLSMDVALMTTSLPLGIWLIVGWFVLDKLRKNIGLARLRKFEKRNQNFINSLNLVIMITGSMGSKKTTTLTDIILSQEVIFRDKAFELIQSNDMKFPHFPWAQFEEELELAIHYGQVFNLTSCKLWIRKKQRRFVHAPCKERIFGYDYTLYPMYIETELISQNIFDVLETYAKLYFVYTVPSSLALSNYSIRSDNFVISKGHFPFWDTDFFERTPADRTCSNYAHILDFDDLRLGKRVDENHASTLEFAVVGITEIGKERGNQVELQGVEKMSDDANQKNDLFNYSLKMARHKATIDNYPFIRFYTDEQRASSWGADAKELCTLLNIATVSDEDLAMPFFFVEELLYGVFFSKFIKLYYEYRHKRSDNCLPLHLMKSVMAFFCKKYVAIHDKYGYFRSKVQTRAGTLEGEVEERKYYVCKKKDYSDRFATDCYSEILTAEVSKQGKGLNDIPTYGCTRPTVDEFKSQKSYFIQDLLRITHQASEDYVLSDAAKQMLDEIRKEVPDKTILERAYKSVRKDDAEKAVEAYLALKRGKKK